MSRRAVRVAGAILLAVLAWSSVSALTDANQMDVGAANSASITYMLGPGYFREHADISPDFAVTAEGEAILSVAHTMHVTNRSSIFGTHLIPLKSRQLSVDSLTADAGGLVLAIADGYFGPLSPEARILKAIPVPYSNARLAPSVHVGAAYLFGGSQNRYRLYRFLDDGILQIVLQSAQPIISVCDNYSSIYVATENSIMLIRPQRPKIIFRAPTVDFEGPIRSIAASQDDVIFFSTPEKVYALFGGNAISVLTKVGGELRIRDNVLYILDPSRKLLLMLKPASSVLIANGSA